MKAREAIKLTSVAIAAVVATFVVFFGVVILLAVLNDPGPMPIQYGEVEDLHSALRSG